jgi:hypothetical protein
MPNAKSKVRPPRPDQLWKSIIEDLWEPFVHFFFAEYADLVDFGREPEFLDKELANLAPPGRNRGRVADKLIKIWLLDGKEAWLLIHVEVQGKPRPDFAQRMAQMGYRIFDRYGVRPVSVAILTDDSLGFEPHHFEVSVWGQSLRFEFLTYKVLHHPPETYADASNPFAIVMEAVYFSLRKHKLDDRARLALKGGLLQKLYAAGHSKKTIYHLLVFLRHIPRFADSDFLPIFEATIDSLANLQPVMSTFELELDYRFRLGIAEGIEKGVEQGIEQGLEKGIEKGIEKGLEKGIEKGLEKGIEQGKQTGAELQLEKVVLMLLSKGFSAKQINEMLEIPLEKIDAIAQKREADDTSTATSN